MRGRCTSRPNWTWGHCSEGRTITAAWSRIIWKPPTRTAVRDLGPGSRRRSWCALPEMSRSRWRWAVWCFPWKWSASASARSWRKRAACMHGERRWTPRISTARLAFWPRRRVSFAAPSQACPSRAGSGIKRRRGARGSWRSRGLMYTCTAPRPCRTRRQCCKRSTRLSMPCSGRSSSSILARPTTRCRPCWT